MRKREQVDESWPDWYDGKRIDEVKFCAAFPAEISSPWTEESRTRPRSPSSSIT